MISVARWCRHLATTVFSILSSAHRVVPRYRFDRLAIHDLNSTFATSSCNEKLQSKKARDNSLQRIVATCKNESTTCCSFVQFSRLSIPPGEGGGGLGGVGGVGVGGGSGGGGGGGGLSAESFAAAAGLGFNLPAAFGASHPLQLMAGELHHHHR